MARRVRHHHRKAHSSVLGSPLFLAKEDPGEGTISVIIEGDGYGPFWVAGGLSSFREAAALTALLAKVSWPPGAYHDLPDANMYYMDELRDVVGEFFRAMKNPRKTGYVKAKIRANTARRNGEDFWEVLRGALLSQDIVLGQTPDHGEAGTYTAYYFESGIPGNPNSEDFWESDPFTGELLWADQAETVRVRMPARATAKEVEAAIHHKLDW
jgi:hypothetical protein